MLVEILTTLLLISGGMMCFAAGLGLVRMPDVYIRMHAATKAGTLGIGFIALAIMLVVPELDVVVKAGLVAVFMITTAPIGSHLIGRAAFRTGSPFSKMTVIDPPTAEYCSPELRAAFEEAHLTLPGKDPEPAAEPQRD